MTSLSDWLQRLETLHPAPMALGLERVAEVFKRLNLDFSNTRVITVAGTNGKGSVVEVLQNLLLDAGKCVGAYTSPHLLRYNERVRINGEPVADESLVAAFEAVEQHRQNTPLTYFEFGTLAALQTFAEAQLDFLVLEIGLGGRLDAVNIVDPDLCVITSIDLDHQAWLGDNRESIGAEKAGIFRAGVPVVCGDADPPASLLNRAAELSCPLYRINSDYRITALEGLHFEGVNLLGHRVQVDYSDVYTLLPGNIATAIQASLLLEGVALRQWSALGSAVVGRQQGIVYDDIEIIFDVSHNPAAARALASHLQKLPPVERCCALFAVMGDKAIDDIVAPMAPVIDAWFLGDLTGNARAKPARDLAPLLHAQGISMISVSKNMRQAFARAVSLLEPGHRLVVFGSVFTVAAIMEIIAKRQSRRSLEEDI